MKRSSAPYLLSLPAAVLIGGLFLGGTLIGFAESIRGSGSSTLSLDAYREVLTSQQFLRSLCLTLWLSVSTTLATALCAVVAAMALRRKTKGHGIISLIFHLPLAIPHMVVALGIIMVISPSGLIARALAGINLIENQSDFPLLISDRLGIGIILVYLWKQIPFLGVLILSVLKALPENYEDQARTLGATKLQTLIHVVLPLIKPALIPGSIICFAYTFGSFEVPYLLGRTHPTTLSVLAYRLFIDPDLSSRPRAMAVAVLMTLGITLATIIYRRSLESRR